MFMLLAAVSFSLDSIDRNAPGFAPTVNLSAVRQLDCVTKDGDAYQGSGYMVAKDIIYSVNHVVHDNMCRDHVTGAKLTAYVQDKTHDFAIFTGNVPLNGPYLKYSCEPFHADETYVSYGYSNAGYKQEKSDVQKWYDSSFLRGYTLVGTGRLTDSSFLVGKELTPTPGLSILDGRIAPGTSGGPIVDMNGYVHGGNNIGGSMLGVPFGPSYSYALHDTVACQSSSK